MFFAKQLTRLGRSLVLWPLAGGTCLFAQITEVPATVAPGQFLLEADLVSFEVDRQADEKYSALVVGAALVTTGITERVDVQVGAQVFITQKSESGGSTVRNSGVGDVYFRTKWRFFESEDSAAAVIPYVKVPTNSGQVGNDSLEGGVVVPYETKLPGGFLVNAQAGADFVRNSNDDGYDLAWAGAVTLGRELTRRISVYGEILAAKSFGERGWAGTVGGGVYLTLSESIGWDFAVYRGLSRTATDWNPVVRLNVAF